MCEANVFVRRGGQEELLMESVDRIIPGEDHSIFMENIFGERRIVKAHIREMELVHHRIILEEIAEAVPAGHQEIWLEPDTDHGHFHPGEEVRLKLYKGYNMRPDPEAAHADLQVYMIEDGTPHQLEMHNHHGTMEIKLDREVDGLVQIHVHEQGNQELYASALVEVGHHHHHGVKPAGLPLEIFPSEYGHARLGENYEIKVLQEGEPLAGTEVRVTYSSTQNKDYPHRLTTDEEGRARIFLTARGNYLFSVTVGNIVSTFTLIKSF
ncbi:MAG: CooT family nickel-binding protein [Syntrophomonadaceae bacterium]|nr:CooT family nickel-binding protein [Syntrophomonadaceae bacterium]